MKISKKYYSGFCLENEEELFSEYLQVSDFTISGFSYGAIKAFEYCLNTKKRVDKLQLFSPAFFQTQGSKYKRMQVMFFRKDSNAYTMNFLENISYQSNKDSKKFFSLGKVEELEELLNYEWCNEKLEQLIQKGTKIEVFLGAEDKIIDSSKAKDFFKDFSTVYYIKEKGHIL